jgi:hypothetical protein
MSDRELLEMAAKAAGYATRGWDATEAGAEYLVREMEDGTRLGWWNPLEDSLDAFHLMLQLDLRVTVYADLIEAGRYSTKDGNVLRIQKFEAGDKEAATRRAIVGAAAAIGRHISDKAHA